MMKRIAMACLLAPLWVPFVMVVVAIWFWSPPAFLADVGRGSWVGMAAALGVGTGYLALFVIGLPMHHMLKRRKACSLGIYLVTWGAAALIAWALVFIGGFARNGFGFALSYLAETIGDRPQVPLTVCLCWMAAGATFWGLVRPDRPDLRN